ncbi:serine/threonine protein phosphatase [Saccharopolyspora subtropica]|uniref:Serine/threonine protein phosphatase n=1 Tax=Saccharopolyspora thermophila TaxID=89367 RepID=A0A917N621_9PSEU|nr:protein phosphatase 2C domain-containing protein [Saccharopolyspora subtropica]GGI68930.1 serine/threonine protein phosphatase [Saccharopolyspora subtropica]
MLTTPHLALTAHARSHAASDRGPRDINADAVATHTDATTGRSAFVVADGIGDHLLAARAARLAATTTAREAVRTGALCGLRRAQKELRAHFAQAEANCVLVVAVLPPADRPGQHGEIAWVGDCRAYWWNGRVLHQATVDHTLAEFWRGHGVVPPAGTEHIVTDSVRTARPTDIGRARIGAGPGRLLLTSDGVHKSVPLPHLKTLLAEGAHTGETAAALVTTARSLGSTDNATAVVVDQP